MLSFLTHVTCNNSMYLQRSNIFGETDMYEYVLNVHFNYTVRT